LAFSVSLPTYIVEHPDDVAAVLSNRWVIPVFIIETGDGRKPENPGGIRSPAQKRPGGPYAG
jgi:hypothetical protein